MQSTKVLLCTFDANELRKALCFRDFSDGFLLCSHFVWAPVRMPGALRWTTEADLARVDASASGFCSLSKGYRDTAS